MNEMSHNWILRFNYDSSSVKVYSVTKSVGFMENKSTGNGDTDYGDTVTGSIFCYVRAKL